MALIKVELSMPPVDGMDIKFKAPCDCTEITGLLVEYPEGSQEFTFRDCHGNNLAGIGNLFCAGAYVKVTVDTVNSFAYLQNADTNAYLEISKLSMELIWKNASPTSEFGPQTVSIDLSGYDAVEVGFYEAADSERIVTAKCKIGKSGKAVSARFVTLSDNGGNQICMSRLYTVSSSGIEFANGMSIKANGATYLRSNMIPVEIYGIKGVTE